MKKINLRFYKHENVKGVIEKIARDFQEELKFEGNLPLRFYEPQQVGDGKYSTECPVVVASSKMYPLDVFSGEVVKNDRTGVLVLKPEYQSLMNIVLKDGGRICHGIKCEKTASSVVSLLKMLVFNIDAVNQTYSISDDQPSTSSLNYAQSKQKGE